MKYVVSAAIIDSEAKCILLAKRSADAPSYPNLWCTPGGKVQDETQLEALRRELDEEVLSWIRDLEYVGEVVYRHNIRSTQTGQMVTVVCYRVPVEAFEGTFGPGDKTSEVRWFSASELKDLQMTPADDANREALIRAISEM